MFYTVRPLLLEIFEGFDGTCYVPIKVHAKLMDCLCRTIFNFPAIKDLLTNPKFIFWYVVHISV
jgi:hypothetical protein